MFVSNSVITNCGVVMVKKFKCGVTFLFLAVKDFSQHHLSGVVREGKNVSCRSTTAEIS